MPEITSYEATNDRIDVHVVKDVPGVEAAGRIYAYDTQAQAEAHADEGAHHVGDWSSPETENVHGKGSISRQHLGRWLIVDQRDGSSVAWSDEAVQAGVTIG